MRRRAAFGCACVYRAAGPPTGARSRSLRWEPAAPRGERGRCGLTPDGWARSGPRWSGAAAARCGRLRPPQRASATETRLLLQPQHAHHSAVVGGVHAGRRGLGARDERAHELELGLGHDPVHVVVPAGLVGELVETAAELQRALLLEA